MTENKYTPEYWLNELNKEAMNSIRNANTNEECVLSSSRVMTYNSLIRFALEGNTKHIDLVSKDL